MSACISNRKYVSDCDSVFDLALIIDSSGSIEDAGVGNFARTLQFLADLTSRFSVGSGDQQLRVRSLSFIVAFLFKYFIRFRLFLFLRSVLRRSARTVVSNGIFSMRVLRVTPPSLPPSSPSLTSTDSQTLQTDFRSLELSFSTRQATGALSDNTPN